MSKELDLDGAVAAGIIGEDQAIALRNFHAEQVGAPLADEEHFRLIGGLADIMAAGGLALALGAITALAMEVPLMAFAAMALAWWGATYFTLKRRMMLSSFVLFGFFVFLITVSVAGTASWLNGQPMGLSIGPDSASSWLLALIGAIGTLACYAYWRVFRLPVAVAVGALAAVQTANNLLTGMVPGLSESVIQGVTAFWGLALFVFAMSWDITDVRRETMRSDVAFWLHCAAGFYLTRTAFQIMLGAEANAMMNGSQGWLLSLAVLAIYALFCLVALVIDRRSLVVSSLVYALPALAGTFGGGKQVAIPMAVLVTGAFLTAMSVFWNPWRARVLSRTPRWITAQVPRPGLLQEGRRPTRRHLDMAPRRHFPAGVKQDAA